MTVRPDWKPERRQKATRRQWERLREGVNVRCAVCGDPSQSAHHVVRRSQGGDDVLANLVGLCGHGTRGCHGLVERRKPEALAAVRRALTVDQLAYVLERKGQAWLDRAYPLPMCVVCDDLGCEHCPKVAA